MSVDTVASEQAIYNTASEAEEESKLAGPACYQVCVRRALNIVPTTVCATETWPLVKATGRIV